MSGREDTSTWLAAVHPDDREWVEQQWQQATAGNDEFQATARLADGTGACHPRHVRPVRWLHDDRRDAWLCLTIRADQRRTSAH